MFLSFSRFHISPRKAALALVGALLLSYSAHLSLMRYDPILAFGKSWRLFVVDGPVLSHSVLAHLPILILGMLAGQWIALCAVNDLPYLRKWPAEIIFWCCLFAVIIVTATPLGARGELPYARYNFPLLPALLALIICSLPRSTFARWIMTRPLVAGLGTISFGVYVYHFLSMSVAARVFVMVKLVPSQQPIAFFLLALFIAIAAASCSYLLVEGPIVSRFRALSDQFQCRALA